MVDDPDDPELSIDDAYVPPLLLRLAVPVRLSDFGDSAGYGVIMSDELRVTIAYDEQDEEGWIAARVLGVPGAISHGRTPEQARENVLDASRVMLAPDQDLSVGDSQSEQLHLAFVR
jgi:predicted RNase H-like HicB family nuclease